MCGIVGFIGREKIVYDLMMGLTALQHRGQDAAGITTFKKLFHEKKGLGLVNNVFEEKHLERLLGDIGIGHVRYTTHGSNELKNAQPIGTNYPFGISMAHNGNITNFNEISEHLYREHHILPNTTNDLELILYTFVSELRSSKDLGNVTPNDIFDAVEATQRKVHGAYAAVAIIANHGLLAFCDPNGIRPMILGKKETKEGVIYGVASETVCFDHLGYEVVRDLEPGEMIFIDNNKKIYSRKGHSNGQRFCVFEFIYFAREDSYLHTRLVAGQRVKMGRQLAEKVRAAGLEPDIVIDVPTSGYFAASGLAEELQIPHRRGLVKSNYIGRSFISSKQSEREDIVKRKLNPISKTVEGKKIAVVDDSIVRGTTSKRIVQILREAGAAEIYFISAAPPLLNPCIYGIDMSVTTELIAANKTVDEIRDYIGADALIYQSLEELQAQFNEMGLNTCMACLSGDYPTANAALALRQIEEERLEAKKQG
ncbi:MULTISPECIES: amidophosphoribosyltransferase [unclassified Aureispira]|uniref:amidophosphoribosyltransferase n=1 Tax=unclassified Aureispira TaxID=2649989 RepID=UPI000698B7C9|nr:MULTISPECIES: amidophosphoribosyltransferase [unclassified Aureispira]WMX15450.1 amidophosphoribosyltransferase [Aureispira sp. CCB-E]